MKANIFKSLSNENKTIEIEAGLPAYKAFSGVDFNNAVLIINGRKTSPDYIIKNSDIVTLRILPADLTNMTGNALADSLISTFLIPFGFIIQPAEIAYKARKEAEESERELEKIKKLTNGVDIDNRPFLRGATNTLGTGKSQPYFCGRNFLTPYLFSYPYYKISGTDGETQEVYNILECGFNGIVLDKLGIGDTTIKTFSETQPQNGVYNINSGVFANGIIEVKQDGGLFNSIPELNYRCVSNVINKEITKQVKVDQEEAEYLIFDVDANTKTLELAIKFPYGLYTYNEDNDRTETQVTITPEYSLDGGNTFTAFRFANGNTFKRNTTKEIRFIATKTFTLSDYSTLYASGHKNIIIRVRSNGNDDTKIKNDCYVMYYQSICFDPNKSSSPAGVLNDGGSAGLVTCLNVEAKERGYSCIMGVKLKATRNNEQKLQQINIIATSTARTWNGSAWTTTKQPTRNPAAIGVEVMTSPAHPASRYNDNEVDLDAWGALYEKCERDGIKFDYLVTQNAKKNDLLEKIATVCNATIYRDIYGRISVAIDQPQENALAVYNPENIISISNKKTFARRVDALRIKYTDSENDNFKENTYLVTRTENGQPVTLDENSIIKDITAIGITTHDQIVKYGRRLMAVDELRQITTSIQIGFEGVYYTPMARIALQDPSLNRDTESAIIESVNYYGGILRSITLKNPVTFTESKNYGVIINCINDNTPRPLALKVTGTGTTRELTVTTAHSISANAQPEKNNIVAFGELDENGEFSKITHDYIITRIARNNNGFSLDLQEYNPAIYDAGEIPAYKPIINNTPTPEPEEIPPDTITAEQLEERLDGIGTGAAQAAVDIITKGQTFTNVYKIKNPEYNLEDLIKKMDEDARNASASISISENEILLQVNDIQRELVGLIDVQAGAVTALVEGGGTSGQMALSLQLPALITEETRGKLITASSESAVNAVYGLIEKSDYYGIKPAATSAAIKTLWEAAVHAGLLASQIELQADQIYIDGDVIVNENKKIKAAKIDTDELKATAGFFNEIEVTNAKLSGIFGKSINEETTDTGAYNFNIGDNDFNTLHYYIFMEDTYRENIRGQKVTKTFYRYVAEFVLTSGLDYIEYYSNSFQKIKGLSIIYQDETYLTINASYNIGDVLALQFKDKTKKGIKITTMRIA